MIYAHLELHDVEAVAERRKGSRHRGWPAREVGHPNVEHGAHQVRPEQAQVPRHQRAPVVPNHERLWEAEVVEERDHVADDVEDGVRRGIGGASESP
jgi:hypothetical protein